MIDILSEMCVDEFSKRIGLDLLNKQNAILEKVVDSEELMECVRGDTVFYIRSSKDFKIA